MIEHVYVLTYLVDELGPEVHEDAKNLSESLKRNLPENSRVLTLVNLAPTHPQPTLTLECINPVYITDRELKAKYDKLIFKTEQIINQKNGR